MLFNLGQEVDRQEFKEYCNQLYKLGKDKGCWVELSKKRHQRSLPQNNYLHCILGYFASEFGLTMDTVKYDLFKKKVNADIFERPRMNKRGQMITYIRSTRFRNWAASEAELYLPAPDEHDALIEAQRQLEAYKEYL